MTGGSFLGWARRLGVALTAAAMLAGCAQLAPRIEALGGVTSQAAAAQAVIPDLPPPPDWRRWFKTVDQGAILVRVDDRILSYWSPGAGEYREYPIAVPRNDRLTRVGATRIVRKRERPDWTPTPDMIRRNPKLPRYVGPGPQNPLGEHAMYLGWRYYAVHGTNNPNSIGTQATSGCIRLYPEDIAELFQLAQVGTPVRVIRGAISPDPRRATMAAGAAITGVR